MSELKLKLAERWVDPVLRVEDTFNVQKADGSIIPLEVPLPQQPLLQEGLIGSGVNYVGSGHILTTVTNKCRQAGFSIISAAEAILICQDFPKATVFYCAPTDYQVGVFMGKLDQLVEDANYYPEELGGGPIIKQAILDSVMTKHINGAHIVGIGANPSTIRSATGIALYLDEMDWMIRFKDQMNQTYTAAKYFVRQGGMIRALSTPRVKDSKFGEMCEEPEKHGAIYHECPAITNWRQLNLNEPLYIDLSNRRRRMQHIRELSKKEIKSLIKRYSGKPMFVYDKERQIIYQKAKIPYPWISLAQLSIDFQSDLEKAKQENLCIAVDESYKLLNSEWIYQNINDDGEIEDREGNRNPFYMHMDFAKKRDVTAITVTENADSIYWERYIAESQDDYDAQVELMWNIFLKFKPIRIGGDCTGGSIGEAIMDMFAKKLRDNGFSPALLFRVNFTSSSKEAMANKFKDWVRGGRYKFLNQKGLHERAIRHCTRVEKEVLQTHVRYTGKMHGRDDHFWSKAILPLMVEDKAKVVKSSVKRFKRVKDKARKRKGGQHIIDELHKQDGKKKEEKPPKRFHSHIVKQDEAITALKSEQRLCVRCGKLTNMLLALHCDIDSCPHRDEAERICRRQNVSANSVRDRCKEYKNG